MRYRYAAAALALVMSTAWVAAGARATESATPLAQRIDQLAAEITAAEDIRAIKKLQRTYGYYLDKGMWTDLAEYFTDDAVANYPAGVFIGKESIRKHLYLNVGSVPVGQVGLGDNRLYNHMNIQPVVHLDPDGQSAKGRWRAFAMFGSFGGGAIWAEGVYEITYAKDNGVWKIKTLDYHSGFGAPYQSGWIAPAPAADGAPARQRGPRQLAHPADRERKMECEGFPAACIAPFHYENPGTSAAGHVWTTAHGTAAGSNDRERVADLAQRASLLRDGQEIENLQRIYGYYFDRRQWDQVTDLFASDGTIEMAQQGVYVGKRRVREFLGSLGRNGLSDGVLNDHIQLQPVVDVAPDGKTARMRSRELAMTGVYQQSGQWSEGIYENDFVKQGGAWKIRSLHFYPTFISDYDKGWGKDAQPAPTVNTKLPPDRPPTQVYEIYPKAHVPPFHYVNPVTGKAPTYPSVGGPAQPPALASLAGAEQHRAAPRVKNVEAALALAELQVARVKDFHELENLEGAYGYYLDKNLWNNLADLFAQDGSMELAQRGVYKGNKRVREFLFAVFGRGQEGPVAGRLGNHVQMQPVIHVADDGRTAKVRLRMMQQLSFGPRASMGASIYENEAVKENGIWKFSNVHTYNTFTANYAGGWAKGSGGGGVPGPSKELPPDGPATLVFTMFPNVYDIPYHYANPVTGRTALPTIEKIQFAPPASDSGAAAP